MIFLQAAPQGGEWTNFALLGAMILVFYFFMIRPQNKKRKKLEEHRNNLKKGDSIITVGGIHGKVVEVKDSTIVIQVEGAVKLKVEKSNGDMRSNPVVDRCTRFGLIVIGIYFKVIGMSRKESESYK